MPFLAHLSATSASCDLIPCFIKRFLTALSCSGSKDAPSINPRASWRRLEALSAGPVERKPCVCQAVGSEKMGRLNSPSDPHLSHGKRFYRPNKGEVGRTLKHFAQCTSIGRKTVFFAVANGAHCASTASKLSGQCCPQPNGREGKKPRSYNHSKPACDHQLDKPVALLVPIHLISCSRALKGSSGLTKKAARLCTQSGAQFLLEATMGGMPPYERSVPVAGLASLLFSHEKKGVTR